STACRPALSPPSLPDALPISADYALSWSVDDQQLGGALERGSELRRVVLDDCRRPLRLLDTPRPLRRAEGWEKFFVEERRLDGRSEEHTSELQSRENLVCRLL